MLKVDRYTKAVLTVIAVCLIVLAFGPILNTSAEAVAVVDVNICEIGGGCVFLGDLPVEVTNWP